MRRELGDGYELDDARGRIDVEAVHSELATSYWATGRSLDSVRSLVDGATRVVGLYHQDRQVGFCRVVSDGETFAFLFDVYVLLTHRGRGLGVELVREAVELGPHRDLRWFLKTRDAHGLYQKFGFGAAEAGRTMERPPGTRSEPE
jgi:GNAT superfamily N-acetyltransferase